jgi:hypothetical protein
MEPVKAIMAMSGCCDQVVAHDRPRPGQKLKTPSGSPAWRKYLEAVAHGPRPVPRA